jgi:hypothetical protein
MLGRLATMAEEAENPADAAGRIALQRMFACLDEGRSFRLEAGAGAGKTYSLDKALRRLSTSSPLSRTCAFRSLWKKPSGDSLMPALSLWKESRVALPNFGSCVQYRIRN